MASVEHPPLYLLAGGTAPSPGGDVLLRRILASLGRSRPRLAYVGAASGDNHSFYVMISAFLRHCGAARVTLAPLASPRADQAKAGAVLEAADAVFVGGGDVDRGMCVLRERGVVPLLRSLHQAGKPFLGVSAGSIMLARYWVRWRNDQDDSSAETFPCLGFADLVCDTHGEAERWEELRALLRLLPEGIVGYGIPSGAGLAVHADGRLEALAAPVVRLSRRGGSIVDVGGLAPNCPEE
ncbi:MAG: Type 1 glutamine amidotransferase-like domain-containing protein [Anaerolineae bacterium]